MKRTITSMPSCRKAHVAARLKSEDGELSQLRVVVRCTVADERTHSLARGKDDVLGPEATLKPLDDMVIVALRCEPACTPSTERV